MDRGSKGNPATECKCGSSAGLDRGICVDCRREYGREYYRRKLATNAAKGGPLVPREQRGFCSEKRRQASPRVSEAPKLAPFVPVQPVTQRGRRVPPAWAPMSEKLQHPSWVEHYTREGSLGWAMREAGL